MKKMMPRVASAIGIAVLIALSGWGIYQDPAGVLEHLAHPFSHVALDQFKEAVEHALHF
jgi:hypothetical protein